MACCTRIFALLLLLICCPVLGQQTPENIRALSPNVVKIRTVRGNEQSYGSGAYLGDGIVATCAHVFFPESRSAKVWYVHASGDSQSTLLYRDPVLDFALVRVQRVPIGVRGLKIAKDSPRRGDRLYPMGFPRAGNDLYCSPSAMTGISGPRRPEGINWGHWITMYSTQGAVVSGQSGGPVVNADGEYVGPVFASNRQNSSTAVNISAIKQHLAQFCFNCQPPLQQRRGPIVQINPQRPFVQVNPNRPPLQPQPGIPFIHDDDDDDVPLSSDLDIQIGAVTTVPAGQDASATITEKSPGLFVLNLRIPRGTPGTPGRDGQDGQPGSNGKDGAPGTTPQINYDELADEVVNALPPVVLEIHDGDEVFIQSKKLGEAIKLRVVGSIKATGG